MSFRDFYATLSKLIREITFTRNFRTATNV
jgi:hypothetical protein